MKTATKDSAITTADDHIPDAVSDRKREHYEEITALAEEASGLESRFRQIDAKAKAAKKAWESAQSTLTAVILRGPNMQPELPFPDDREPDAWRDVPLGDVLTLTDRQCETLADADVTTVGAFEDLRAGDGLTSLKGIGQTTAEKWEQQMLDWLADHARESDNQPDGEMAGEEDE